jgi:hypothetical protein
LGAAFFAAVFFAAVLISPFFGVVAADFADRNGDFFITAFAVVFLP